MTFDEFILPTKEEIAQLRSVGFNDFVGQAYMNKKLKDFYLQPKNRLLSCLNCKTDEDKIKEAQDSLKEHLRREKAGLLEDADYWKGEEFEPYHNQRNIVLGLQNNSKQKMVDLLSAPISHIKKGNIIIEIGYTRDYDNNESEYPADKFVVGLQFYHKEKFCFLCTSCWNALITQPNITKVFGKENLQFFNSSIPSEESIKKALPLILEVIEQ